MKGVNELNYVYAIRNKTTGKLQVSRCGKSGKFYENVGFAKRRCDEFNKDGYNSISHERGEFEVVKFELREVEM